MVSASVIVKNDISVQFYFAFLLGVRRSIFLRVNGHIKVKWSASKGTIFGGQGIEDLSRHPEQAALYLHKGQAISDPGGRVDLLVNWTAPC